MMGGFIYFICFFQGKGWVRYSIFFFLEEDLENNGVIQSDRQATRAMCWENPKDLPACDISDCSRSDR